MRGSSNTEEPLGPSRVSQALNAKNRLALQTTELTALAVLTQEVSHAQETAASQRVQYNSIKEKLRAQLDILVDDIEFQWAFEFVIEQGGGKAAFVADLLEFGSLFVDQKAH